MLFVGTWTGRKRGAQLAEAFVRDVLPVVPDAELRMVTRDAPATLPAGVAALGRLDDDELVAEYGRAWVFCLPSSYEGFGIPYAEAMAAGLPVVATPNIGARYVTDEGRAGVLASLDDVGTAVRRGAQGRSDAGRDSAPPGWSGRARSTSHGSSMPTSGCTGRRDSRRRASRLVSDTS